MGSKRLLEGRVMLAALVEQEEDEDEDGGSDSSGGDRVTVPTFDVPYFRYIDEEGTEDEEWRSSSRSLSSIEEEDSIESSLSHRYASVPASPEKVLEHLLSHLTLDEDNGSPQARETGGLSSHSFLTLERQHNAVFSFNQIEPLHSVLTALSLLLLSLQMRSVRI